MDKQKRTIIVNYLRNYILVLLVPVTLVIIVYFWTLNIVEGKTFDANLSVLQHNMEIMENGMDNIGSLVYQVSINPSINQFIRSESPFTDKTSVADIVEAQETLAAFALTNSFIDSIHVYSNRSKVVIDQTTSFIRPNFLYELSFSYAGYSYSDWVNDVLLKTHQKEVWPASTVFVNNTQYQNMLYLQSIPVGSNALPVGCILVFISEKRYTSLFESVGVSRGGWYYVRDDQGKVLTGSKTFDTADIDAIESDLLHDKGYAISEVDGQRMFITYAQGSRMPWRYVMAMPYQDVVQETDGLRFLLGMLIAFTLAGGILLAVYLAYQSSRPIGNILALLSGTSSRPITLTGNSLETEVTRIIRSNERLSQELANTIPAQKTAALNRLLRGEYEDVAQLQADFMRFNIDVRGNYYVVLLIQFNDLDTSSSLEELGAYKVLLGSSIDTHFDHIIGVYDIDIDRMVLVASSMAARQPDLVLQVESRAQAIHQDLFVQHRISISFAGHLVDELGKIPLAFFYAKQAMLTEKAKSAFKVSWFKKPEDSQDSGYYYPIDLEVSLINAVVNGNPISAEKILATLYKHNSKASHASRPVQSQFISSLKTTLLRICEKMQDLSPALLAEVEDLPVALNDTYQLREAFLDIQTRILELCEQARREERDVNKGIKRGILSFVHEQYTNAQLSLSMVADHFSISEVYLSRIFKEYTGENFSKYVEALRMKEARRLIEEGTQPIYKIAQLVGYNSPQVFRRVYHRYFGFSPSNN